MSKPVAVIRKVEDSPDWLDRRLVEAYLCSVYRLTALPFVIRIGQYDAPPEAWLNARGFDTYVFITAWNPGSKILSDRQNRQRNGLLKADLTAVAPLVLDGTGAGDTGDWPAEESFWVPGISAGNAIALGKKYGQNAVVWWKKGGVPELWWLQFAPRR